MRPLLNNIAKNENETAIPLVFGFNASLLARGPAIAQ